jgi:hypothetical protein
MTGLIVKLMEKNRLSPPISPPPISHSQGNIGFGIKRNDIYAPFQGVNGFFRNLLS